MIEPNFIRTKLQRGQYAVGSKDTFFVPAKKNGSTIRRVIQDAYNGLSNGQTGNLTASFLGSYDGDYKIVRLDTKNHIALVRMHVWNVTGLESATRNPIQGYRTDKVFLEDEAKQIAHRIVSPLISPSIGPDKIPTSILHNRSKGPGRSVRQDFEWYENVHY